MQTTKEYWRLAGALGGTNVLGRVRLFLRLFLILLLKKITGRRPRPLKLAYEERAFTLHVRDGADIAVLREIFADGEYAADLLPPRAILDIGGHIGASAAFFACRYPEARITVYEPDPENVLLLQKNLRQFPQAACVPAAVSDRAGERPFFANTRSSIASSLTSRGGPEREVRVRSVSLSDLLRQENPDLVKFDIEGGEYDMFSGAREELQRCKTFIGEVHYDLIKKSKEEFAGLFAGYAHAERPVGPYRSILLFSLK